jgi:hypothetical protein|tara:strand:+ start:7498 stop:7899 length:402 start_codon:yes stop_codon:yes gene_type:complete
MYYEGFALQNNNNITPIKINLGVARKEAMNERFQHRHGHIKVVVGRRNLSKFGSAVKEIMKAIFNGRRVPVNIIGTRNEVNSFIEALKQEKQYFKTAKKYGLDNPRTYKYKYRLRRAVAQFERDTGLKWPLES